MALISKPITTILIEVRDTLQDQQKSRWSDQELARYLDQAVRNVALVMRHDKIIETLTVNSTNKVHTLTKEAIDFYNLDSKQSYTIDDARTITFSDGEEEEVDVEYYAFPARIVWGTSLDVTLEEDLYDCVRFYMLYRAYQKEASTENIRKAQYFDGEYQKEVSKNTSRWHSKFNITTSRTDFL